MEGQYNSQLHPEGTQSQELNNGLKDFNLDDYFSWLNRHFEGIFYYLFDTGIYVDLGANQLKRMLKQEISMQDLELMLNRSIEHGSRMIKLIEGEKNIITNKEVINELMGIKAGFIEGALEAQKLFQDRESANLFYRKVSEISGIYDDFIRLMSKRIRNNIKTDYPKTARSIEEILRYANHKGDSSEDESLVLLFFKSLLKKPTRLFSGDKHTRILYDLVKQSLDKDGTRSHLKLKQRAYIAYDRLYDKIKRHMVFEGYLTSSRGLD